MGHVGSGLARNGQPLAPPPARAAARPAAVPSAEPAQASPAAAWQAASEAAEGARLMHAIRAGAEAAAASADTAVAAEPAQGPVDIEIGAEAARPVRERKADDRPEARPTEAVGDECAFEARTSEGMALLEIDARTARAHHALDAAVLLDRCEPMLRALEAWIGAPLDWRWCGAGAGRAMVVPQALARWRVEPAGSAAAKAGKSGVVRGTLVGRLSLPWPLLRGLPPPPAGWSDWLKWQGARSVLALAWPRVPTSELALLEPGGVLLLPESMQRDWRARLRSAEEPARNGIGAPVVAAAERATNLVALIAPHEPAARAAEARAARTPSGSESDGVLACEVRLSTPKLWPAEWLAGWAAGARLEEAGPAASLWSVSGEGYGRSQCLALGHLMPWGDGWALRIEALKPRRRAAASAASATTVALPAAGR